MATPGAADRDISTTNEFLTGLMKRYIRLAKSLNSSNESAPFSGDLASDSQSGEGDGDDANKAAFFVPAIK
jgi:hypothetical protein